MLGLSTTKKQYHNFFTLTMVFCAGLGGILYGYDIGVISGALLFIKKIIPMSRDQVGFIVGAVLTGGLVGTLITGSLADKFGRRSMILAACIVFVAGIITILTAQSFTLLLIARLLLGIGVGIIAVAVPLYLSEIAPAKIRGRSITIFQLFLTLGILLAYLVDLFFTPTGNWRGMFAVLFIPTTILFVSMLFLPETPRWLLAKKYKRAACRVLIKTRGIYEAKREMRAINSSLNTTHGCWKALFERCFWLPLFVALTIAILNQLTGINVLLQYAPLVIQQAGLNSHVGIMLGTVGMGAINLIGTVLCLFLIDHVGRRKLLLIGTAGIIISYIYLACLTNLLAQSQLQAELSIVGLLGYILFYAIGPGVVVWLVISELMPTKVRGKAVALCLFVNSLAAAVISTTFLSIEHTLGMSGTYWLFAAFTIVYFLVTYFLLPETKNKTLEEIQEFYQEQFADERIIPVYIEE